MYWWLTWTWENLWLACKTCQAKSGRFPLIQHSPRLSTPNTSNYNGSFDLSQEEQMWLDPAVDSYQDHVRFEEVPPTGGWDWSATSTRGQQTIEDFKLNRVERTGFYERLKQHISRRLEPRVQNILTHITDNNIPRATDIWEALLREHCAFENRYQSEYLIPTWWYLKKAHQTHELGTHGLTLPPYPDQAPNPANHTPSTPPPLDDGMTWTSSQTGACRMHILFIKNSGRVPNARLDSAVLALCTSQPQTVTNLGKTLGRKEGAIRGALKRLRDKGDLQVRPQSRPHIYEP